MSPWMPETRLGLNRDHPLILSDRHALAGSLRDGGTYRRTGTRRNARDASVPDDDPTEQGSRQGGGMSPWMPETRLGLNRDHPFILWDRHALSGSVREFTVPWMYAVDLARRSGVRVSVPSLREAQRAPLQVRLCAVAVGPGTPFFAGAVAVAHDIHGQAASAFRIADQ